MALQSFWQPVSGIVLKDGSTYEVDDLMLDVLARAYPRIDVAAELAKMQAWCLCNPAQRKTRSGAARFVNSWLSRANERPAPTVAPVASTRKRSLYEDLTDTSWAT